MDRRKFLQGAAALFAAPAIVRAESLMPIYVPPEKRIIGHDITELVYDISPTDTPILTVLQQQRHPYHVWVQDELTSDHLHSHLISELNGQIFRKQVHTTNGSGRPSAKSEHAYQMARKIKEMKRDMEYALGRKIETELKVYGKDQRIRIR